MKSDPSAFELAARLILGDLKATRVTTHPVFIDGGTVYQVSHFGHGGSCRCCGGTAGSVKVDGDRIEVCSRAYHKRRVFVFVLEPADADQSEMQPSERELCGDALTVLAEHVGQR